MGIRSFALCRVRVCKRRKNDFDFLTKNAVFGLKSIDKRF